MKFVLSQLNKGLFKYDLTPKGGRGLMEKLSHSVYFNG